MLFTSGYTDNAIVHAGRLDEGIELLSKPYSMARKIRHVLRNQQQRRAASAVRAEQPSERPVPSPSLRRLRILLVEDDDLIRAGTAEMLRTLGLDVVEARDGGAATAMLQAHPIDVLIADVGLPDISGVDLASHALELRPQLRIVFASGYDAALSEDKRERLAASRYLRKPYNLDDLLRVLEQQTAAR